MTPEAVTQEAGRDVPVRYRQLYRRALAGELSPRQTIKAKCLECCCWKRHDEGIDQIADCVVRSCPLWALRPFQTRAQRPQAPDSGTSREERASGDPEQSP